ncbi:MAG: hypothetical protein JEZ03_02145 [Bacteroidales bacterium]|nr:hypothetical protein [Bacteroidales bacterium]
MLKLSICITAKPSFLTIKLIIMKRFIAVLFVGALLVSMASCKKDYTCECTVSVEGMDPVVTPALFQDVTKSEATDACEQLDAVSTMTTCELK